MREEQAGRTGGLSRVRRRLSYANVMSTIAVFGVLAGGGAYAASKIGSGDIKRNAVRSKHIKSGQVKPADLADGSVSSAKVADDSLTGDDVDESSLGQVPDADTLDGIDSTGFVTAGEAGAGMVTARINGLPEVPNAGGPDQFGAVSGLSNASADPEQLKTLSPAAPVVASDLAVIVRHQNTGGNRTFTLLVNNAPTLSCTMFAGVTQCSSGGTAEIPAAATLVFRVESDPFSIFNVNANEALIGWRATSP